MLKAFVSVLLLSFLTACAGTDFGSPNTYQRYDVQRLGHMEEATIVRVRQITIEASSDSSGLTTIVSSAASALLGSQIMGNGRGRYVSGALSGAAAAFVAQHVSAAMSRHSGIEVFLRKSNGQTVVLSQVDDQQFAPGDHVYLISNGSGYRITH